MLPLVQVSLLTITVFLPICVTLFKPGTVQADANNSLITYWKFDEPTAGSTVIDSSGSGFSGTPEGISGGVGDNAYLPQPSTDVPPVSFSDPYSLYFQGDGGPSTGSYINVSNWNVDTANGFTVSLWAKPTTSPGSSWERFFDFGNGPSSDNIIFAQDGGSTSVYFEVYNGSSTTKIIAPAGTWEVGSWHLYTATIDANGNATIYIDGNPVVSGTTNKPLDLTRSNEYIGKSNWGDDYYQGYMDDFRFYDTALTSSEVQSLSEGDSGPGVALTPTFGTVSPTADGYTVQITNYDSSFNWSATTSSGTVSISSSGLVTVSGLAASQSATVSVSNTKTGYPDGSANTSGQSLGLDLTGDGLEDSSQPNVADLTDPTTNEPAVVKVGTACTLSDTSVEQASAAGNDPGYSYPLGMLNFTAACGTPGFTTTVTQYYYDPPNDSFVLRKVVNGRFKTVTGADFSHVIINGQPVLEVSYPVTDGGPFDDDGVANGVIVDPAGLAVPSSTLTDTGENIMLITLAAGTLILGAVGIHWFHRPQK